MVSLHAASCRNRVVIGTRYASRPWIGRLISRAKNWFPFTGCDTPPSAKILLDEDATRDGLVDHACPCWPEVDPFTVTRTLLPTVSNRHALPCRALIQDDEWDERNPCLHRSTIVPQSDRRIRELNARSQEPHSPGSPHSPISRRCGLRNDPVQGTFGPSRRTPAGCGRCAARSLVTGKPFIRFYAAALLHNQIEDHDAGDRAFRERVGIRHRNCRRRT